MKKQEVAIVLLIISAILCEELHQLFSSLPYEKKSMFPFDETKISVQWYVYDLCACVSQTLIASALVVAVRFNANLKSICLIYLLYRFIEIIVFVLWNKQDVYSWFLLFFGVLFFILLRRWKKV